MQGAELPHSDRISITDKQYQGQATTPTAFTVMMSSAMKIIDCDVHQCWASFEEVSKRLPAAFRQPGWVLPGVLLPSPVGVLRADAVGPNGEPPGSCPQTLIRQLFDGFGVTTAILTGASALSAGVHPNCYFATALTRAYNDALAETWLQEDERFYGSIIIAPQDPEAAAAEIRRWAGHPKIVQVLMTSSTRIPLGQKFYWPIYEAAAECGFPVAVHPGAEGRGIANGFIAGEPTTYLEWHTNLSQNYMGQVVSLLCEGVFEKFPGMRFVCIEGGLGWIPHVLWRLDKNWKALRSSVPWVRRLPSEYAWDHLRFTTQPIEEPEKPEHLLAILEMVHAEKTVMFSSDYPHWDNDSPMHGLPKLPEALARRIFHETAEELYGLTDTPTPAPAGEAVA
jgi:predicted TIM-barrel fold metal-dependent hydrolase